VQLTNRDAKKQLGNRFFHTKSVLDQQSVIDNGRLDNLMMLLNPELKLRNQMISEGLLCFEIGTSRPGGAISSLFQCKPLLTSQLDKTSGRRIGNSKNTTQCGDSDSTRTFGGLARMGRGVDRGVHHGNSNSLDHALLVVGDAATTTWLLPGSSDDLCSVGLACLELLDFFGGHQTSSMEIRGELFVVHSFGEGKNSLLMRLPRGSDSFQNAIDTGGES